MRAIMMEMMMEEPSLDERRLGTWMGNPGADAAPHAQVTPNFHFDAEKLSKWISWQ